MLLLILAGIWVAVAVGFFRSRIETTRVDSIVDFHRQLRVLQRTRPSRGLGVDAVDGGRYAEAVEPVGLRAVGGSRVGSQNAVVAAPRYVQHSAHRSASPAAAAARRARTIRRRRDVMFSLLMAVGSTFVLAMVLSSSLLWMLQVFTDVLLLAFVGLLVRMRNIEAEKEMKLRILPQPQPVPALAMRRPATN